MKTLRENKRYSDIVADHVGDMGEQVSSSKELEDLDRTVKEVKSTSRKMVQEHFSSGCMF